MLDNIINYIKKFFGANFNEIWLISAAVIVTIVLVPLGIVWNIGKSIYELFQYRFWLGLWKFVKYWIKLAYQFWLIAKYLMYHTAIALDLIWNVAAGELLEDIVTDEEETVFSDGEVTVSAAVGRQHARKRLTKVGSKFSHFLNGVFNERHHALTAWYRIHLNYDFDKTQSFEERLTNISALPDNWDGFGSNAPSVEVIEHATDLVDITEHLTVSVHDILDVADIRPTASNTILFKFINKFDNDALRVVTFEVGEHSLHIRAYDKTAQFKNDTYTSETDLHEVASEIETTISWLLK